MSRKSQTLPEPPKPDPELEFRPYLSDPKFWEEFNKRVEECNKDASRKEEIARLKRESLIKPIRAGAAPAAPKTNFCRKQKTHQLFGGKYVNPNGMDSHYYDLPLHPEMKKYHDSDDIEHDVVRDKRYPPFEESNLVYKDTVDIAKRILNTDFRFSFVFHMDIMIGLCGIRRHLVFYMNGHDTYTDLEAQIRDQYTEGDNFQLFYMNFDGQYMEIHDNLTLKQALITHGAYPRGAYCTFHNVSAKFWLVPSTRDSEEYIFKREREMILAADAPLMERQENAMAEHLPFFLTPELQFEPVYNEVIHYTDAEYARPYNKFMDALELLYECQQVRVAEDLFKDTRTKKIDYFQIMACFKDRYSAPYNNLSPDDSVHRDYLIIMDGLQKSKHQTKEALQEIESAMKKEMADWKAFEAVKRARMPVQVILLPSGFSGPHSVQHIPNPSMRQDEIDKMMDEKNKEVEEFQMKENHWRTAAMDNEKRSQIEMKKREKAARKPKNLKQMRKLQEKAMEKTDEKQHEFRGSKEKAFPLEDHV